MGDNEVGSKFYTTNESARVLKVSRTKIYDLMKNGQLEYIEICGMRRIPVAEIDRISLVGVPKAGKSAA
jgi:excisionase family DNA binding protein